MSPTSYQAAPPRINRADLSDRRSGLSSGPAVPSAHGRTATRSPDCVSRPRPSILRGRDRDHVMNRSHASRPPIFRRSVLIRRRLLPWMLIAVAFLGKTPQAQAQAEVHKLNLMFSANPSSFKAEDYKNFLDDYNSRVLLQHDLKPLDNISWGWRFEAELRYFVSSNVAVSAGAG